MKIEAVLCFESSVDFYQTMWHHITAESILTSHTSLNCSGIRRFIALNNIQIAVSSIIIFVNALENCDKTDNSEWTPTPSTIAYLSYVSSNKCSNMLLSIGRWFRAEFRSWPVTSRDLGRDFVAGGITLLACAAPVMLWTYQESHWLIDVFVILCEMVIFTHPHCCLH